MPIRHTFIVALIVLLLGCGRDELNLTLQLDGLSGLQPGDTVVLRNQPVGEVTAVEAAGQSGYLAKLAIESELVPEATQSARFLVGEDPDNPGRRRVEILPGDPDDALLADGATVRGSIKQAPLFPLEEILRSFTEGLGILRDQVERFESDIRRVPESEEAQRLRDEWARLLDEIQRAQAATEESVKRDLLPKLQQELQDLEEELRALEARPRNKPQTI
ncbi:hypothetical protein [Methylocaldum sp.]|uniref:MlaD family protein n=1 Tax=Methylocaldum sp. TaxID=1969727 RepID=UPI002D431FAE|nr:hypothetical protein [Methylocaldum sp.]HYE36682.1 hypothetical protein [Methylocaldum sp.]